MIDGQFLSRIVARIWGAVLFILPFVVSSMSFGDESAPAVATSDVLCNLTPQESATITTMMALHNEPSCSFNMTLGSIIGR
eukprot:SAG22_NODE_2745_length_2257_cov_1.690918_2_plen_81_part_00